MLEVRIQQKIASALKKRMVGVTQALRLKIDSLSIALQAHIVRDKLSGQVLHHRTGKLAGSIRVIRAAKQNGKIQGGVEGALFGARRHHAFCPG